MSTDDGGDDLWFIKLREAMAAIGLRVTRHGCYELVTLNSDGDLRMDPEARPFIGTPCVMVKVTKAGLYQVALLHDQQRTYSAPKRNVQPYNPRTDKRP